MNNYHRARQSPYQKGYNELSEACPNPNCKKSKVAHTTQQAMQCKKFQGDPTRFSVEPEKMKHKIEHAKGQQKLD